MSVGVSEERIPEDVYPWDELGKCAPIIWYTNGLPIQYICIFALGRRLGWGLT